MKNVIINSFAALVLLLSACSNSEQQEQGGPEAPNNSEVVTTPVAKEDFQAIASFIQKQGIPFAGEKENLVTSVKFGKDTQQLVLTPAELSGCNESRISVNIYKNGIENVDNLLRTYFITEKKLIAVIWDKKNVEEDADATHAYKQVLAAIK